MVTHEKQMSSNAVQGCFYVEIGVVQHIIHIVRWGGPAAVMVGRLTRQFASYHAYFLAFCLPSFNYFF